MTERVNPSPNRQVNAFKTSASISQGGASGDGYIVDGALPTDVSRQDGDINHSALNTFTQSSSGSSLDVTIDPGEAFIYGSWLVKDTSTTVSLSASTNNQTVYVGWDKNSNDDVIIGTASAFSSTTSDTDQKLPLYDFDTDGSGITNVTDRRQVGKKVVAEHIESDGSTAIDVSVDGATAITFDNTGDTTLGGDLVAKDNETIWDESSTEIPDSAMGSIANSTLINSSLSVAGNSVSLGSSTSVDYTDLSDTGASFPIPNTDLANSSVSVAGNSVSLGGSTNVDYVDLSDTGVSFPIPNADIANSTVTFASNTVSLGGSTSVDYVDLSDTGNSFPIPNTDLANTTVSVAGNSVSLGGSTSVDYVDLSDTGASFPIPNTDLANSSVTVAGNSVSLGGSVSVTYTELSDTGTSFPIPNTDLANSSVSVAGNSVSLGGSTTVNYTDLSDTSTSFPIPNSDLTNDTVTVAGNSVSLGGSTSVDYVDLSDTGASFPIPNTDLANSSVTVAGNSVSLGGSATVNYTDLSDTGTSFPIPNSDLANNTVTVAGKSISLGGSTTLGLSELTDTDLNGSTLINSTINPVEVDDNDGFTVTDGTVIIGDDLTDVPLQLGRNQNNNVTSNNKTFTFSADGGRDIHQKTKVSIVNYTSQDIEDSVTVDLYDGTDSSGTQIASNSTIITLPAGEGTTVPLIDTPIELDNGDYYIEVSTGFTVTEVNEIIDANIYTFQKTVSGGDMLLQNELGDDLLQFSSTSGDATIGKGDLIMSPSASIRDSSNVVRYDLEADRTRINNDDGEKVLKAESGFRTDLFTNSNETLGFFDEQSNTLAMELESSSTKPTVFNMRNATLRVGDNRTQLNGFDASNNHWIKLSPGTEPDNLGIGFHNSGGVLDRVEVSADLRFPVGNSIEDGSGVSRININSDATEIRNEAGERVIGTFGGEQTSLDSSTNTPLVIRDRDGGYNAIKYVASATPPGNLELNNSNLQMGNNGIGEVGQLSFDGETTGIYDIFFTNGQTNKVTNRYDIDNKLWEVRNDEDGVTQIEVDIDGGVTVRDSAGNVNQLI